MLLLSQIEKNIHSKGLLRPGQRLVVAVSGGLDSMVLLWLLSELSSKSGWRLTVAHLNHSLRGRSSDADQRLVGLTARELKLPFILERTDVRAFARGRGLSLEMAARQLRHDFLARAARQAQAKTIALAHHADDQLELFFLRLFRGSASDGLAGMKWRNPSPSDPESELIRPLLDQPKAALREFALESRIAYREDASNALVDIQRNRIRHHLLPLLRREYQPALDKTILRTMDVAGAEGELARQAALEWLKGVRIGFTKAREAPDRSAARGLRTNGEGPCPFEKLPIAVQRRCLHLQLLDQGITPDYGLVERLRTVAEQPVTVGAASLGLDQAAQAGTCSVFRDTNGLVHLQPIRRFQFSGKSMELDLGSPTGKAEFDGAGIRWRILSRRSSGRLPKLAGREWFDADQVGSPVILRHWQPGDRFEPIGLGKPVKLQDWFTNQKVPRARRHQLVVAATAKGEVFWVEDQRIGERFRLSKKTIHRLQWRWQRL
ncbi:tRNA(Ile)-lysidine synthase [Verrucomicrobia bacterium]|nr:tRNA(Ile)-lysidine synthase [Verrucomicrobiota bacterium]